MSKTDKLLKEWKDLALETVTLMSECDWHEEYIQAQKILKLIRLVKAQREAFNKLLNPPEIRTEEFSPAGHLVNIVTPIFELKSRAQVICIEALALSLEDLE